MYTDSGVILILLTAIAGQIRHAYFLKSIYCRSIDLQHQCECALVNANIDNLSLLHVKIYQKSNRPRRLRITYRLPRPEGPDHSRPEITALRMAGCVSELSVLDQLFDCGAYLLRRHTKRLTCQPIDLGGIFAVELHSYR